MVMCRWKEKNRSTHVKNLRKDNVYKFILFSNLYIKNEIQTGSFLTRFLFWHEPAFPIYTDTLKYVLAQATDWCAGFVVRVWWRYLSVRFNRHSKMACKILNMAKRRESHFITSFTVLYLSSPYRSLAPYKCSEYPDL
jgi:hypothetical protein